MIGQRALEAIESSDTDELLRVIDGYCAAAAWADLIDLRRRCREALGRGKQLWGVEEHVRYRLVLEGPVELAGPIVSEGHSRFALGPLPEVAASTKTWADLSPHLAAGPPRSTFAAERVVRGDEVEDEIPDLPANLMPWEPDYPVAVYKSDRLDAPAPGLPAMEEADLPGTWASVDDPASEGALVDLVQPWTDESNGRCQVATVRGASLDAVSALGLTRARIGTLSADEALSWLGWAAASGGAHGRRRGAAAGRYMAWWLIANLADLDWPADPALVGEAALRLSWSWFDDGSPDSGWVLRLVIEDPANVLSWVISAVDLV